MSELNKSYPVSPEKEQEILLQVVETWRLSEVPEYRGFKCANCQQFKDQAWYHWVNTGGYKLPIHMCNDTCEPAFIAGNLQIDQGKRAQIDRVAFGSTHSYPEKAVERFRQITSAWPEYKEPELKAFTCDACERDLTIETLSDNSKQRQGYHVWWKMDDGFTLAELHFHRDCGHRLGLLSRQEIEEGRVV